MIVTTLLSAQISLTSVVAIAGPTFADTEMYSSSWEYHPLYVPDEPDQFLRAFRFPSEAGNPGLCVEWDISYSYAGGYWFAMMNEDFAPVDPAAVGPLSAVSIALDGVVRSGFGEVAVDVAIVQGGRVYLAEVDSSLSESGWSTLSTIGTPADEFVEVGEGELVEGSHPDFGSNGEPIQFGYLVRGGPTIFDGVGFAFALDNFEVQVELSPVSAPALSHDGVAWLGFGLLGIGGGLVRRRVAARRGEPRERSTASRV
ncbi:MAG: hypothetical protein B7733_01380 [Myxococcales bacterium FL481]|nr:MAG: hypothetical protein B7733_01380 [Myxococcales bacterium FL481]